MFVSLFLHSLAEFPQCPYSMTMTELLATCLGLCLQQHTGAMQSQQIPGCFHEVLRVFQCIKAEIPLCAGVAQCDFSVSGMGRAAHPLCVQQSLKRVAVCTGISKSWDVQLSRWEKQIGLQHGLLFTYLQEEKTVLMFPGTNGHDHSPISITRHLQEPQDAAAMGR